MGKIKKLKGTDLIGGINNEDVYPITSTKAVFDEKNTSLHLLLNALESSVETVKETANSNTSSILQEVSRAKTVEKQLEDSIKKIEPYIKVVWNYDSNINTYIDSGIYNIKGTHLRKEDNLPLESIDAEATFNANLIVLDSTINVLGGIDGGACITQILSISDRVGGEGNVYIRTGRGYIKTVDAITWDSWSVMQTTTDVGIVKDEQHNDGSGWVDGKGMNSLGKAGFYRGFYFDKDESFFLLVIDSKQAPNFGPTSLNLVTQFKYGLPINGGEISLKVRRGAPKLDDLDVPIEGEFAWGEWKDFGGDSTPTITWQGQNLNDYTDAGVYNIQGKRVNGDNIPISNEGVISARLTVLSTDDGAGNTVITQVLALNNNSGGEGNVYVRSSQKGSWKPWGKLQTNIEVGMVNTLDNLTDNGMYSGILAPNVETFVLVVINNYQAAVPAGYGWYVSQLKYSLGLNGTVTVKTRRMDYTNTWTEWEELKGGAGTSNIEAQAPLSQKDGKLSLNIGDGLKVEDNKLVAIPQSGGDTSNALRALFIAAGAEYNDSGVDIIKTTPWSAFVDETDFKAFNNIDVLNYTTADLLSIVQDGTTYNYVIDNGVYKVVSRASRGQIVHDERYCIHRRGHYYLNGLGDITEEQMMTIYNNKAALDVILAGLEVSTRLLQDIITVPRTLLPPTGSLRRFDNKKIGGYYMVCAGVEVVDFAGGNWATSYIPDINAGDPVFYNCDKLIAVSPFRITKAINLFFNCPNLRYVAIKSNNSLNFKSSPNISKKSILYAINNSTATNAVTITLHPDAYTRLENNADIVSALSKKPLVTLVSA